MQPILIIEFDFMPPAVLRGNARPSHWSQRARVTQQTKDTALWRLREAIAEQCITRLQCPIQITYRVFYCGTPIDRDNFIQGAKAWQDAIKEAGLIEDDSPEYVWTPAVEYERVAQRNQVRVRMEIAEVPRAFLDDVEKGMKDAEQGRWIPDKAIGA